MSCKIGVRLVNTLDADGSRTLTQTAQRSPTSPPPSPRTTRERPRGIRAEHLRGGFLAPSTRTAARRRATALHPAAVPGAWDGQELALPAPAQRGDPQHKAGAHHKGKARRARTIPPKPPLSRPRP